MTRAGGRRAVGWAAGLAGIGFLLQGLWIPAKAWVAQYLLEAAWGEAQHSRAAAPAWPWADSWPVALLTYGKTRLIVLSPGGGESLAFGPALVAGSALPGKEAALFGVSTAVTVVAGHRDTHFAGLGRLKVGDLIALETLAGEVFTYHVADVRVLEESWIDLPAQSARPTLILASCWPLDGTIPGGQERYIVVAEG